MAFGVLFSGSFGYSDIAMRNRKVLDECNEPRVGGHTTYSYSVRHNANEMDDVLPFDFDEILQCILQETHDLEF